MESPDPGVSSLNIPHGNPERITMAPMGKGKHEEPNGPSFRARFAAWIVFLSMAGTTMAFQVYHSIKVGHMPWPLAGLYGVVPLLISICILEIVAEWHDARGWVKWAAYAIMSGAMYLSASATGNVVFHAAPKHMSGLFGLLMDGAALLAAHALLNGPRKAPAVLAVPQPTAKGAATTALPVAPEWHLPEAMPGATGEAAAGAIPGAAEGAIQGPPEGPSEEPRQRPSDEPLGEPSQRPSQELRPKTVRVSEEPDAKRARAQYRKSLLAGQPLSDRALGDMFSRSRSWGASRIRECEAGPHLTAKTGS